MANNIEGHIDAVLSNISVAYMGAQKQFICSEVFPVVPVEKQSNLYYIYNKGDWFRDEAQQRADGVESVGSSYHLSTDTYLAKVWAFHKDVGPQARANFDIGLDADRDASVFVAQRLMLRQEVQWVTDYFQNGIWGTSVTPAAGDKWSAYATSDPIEQIEDAKEAILSSTGYEPNTLVVGYQVDRKLRNHPMVKTRFQYTTAESITSEMVARFLNIDKYVVAKSIRNVANEGAADAFQFNHGKHALLMYVNPSPSLLTPSAGYTFMWKGISHGIGTDIAISRIPTPLLGEGTLRIEGQIAYANKIVAADLGYWINNAVA